MMFLLRLAFWITLICLLLPGSGEDNRRLITSAEQAVSDVRGFCQRNPQVCADSRVAMTSLLSKLKNGVDALTSLVAQADTGAGQQAGASPDGPASKRAPELAPKSQIGPAPAAPRLTPKWQDSLNPGDKQMPWRGPSPL